MGDGNMHSGGRLWHMLALPLFLVLGHAATSVAADTRPELACRTVAECARDDCGPAPFKRFRMVLGDDDIELYDGNDAYLWREVPMRTRGMRAFHGDSFGSQGNQAVLTLVGTSGGHLTLMPQEASGPWAMIPFTCQERADD